MICTAIVWSSVIRRHHDSSAITIVVEMLDKIFRFHIIHTSASAVLYESDQDYQYSLWQIAILFRAHCFCRHAGENFRSLRSIASSFSRPGFSIGVCKVWYSVEILVH